MQQRTIFNTTAAAAGAFSFLGVFGRAILHALGFVDQAQDLASAMKLISNLPINWTGFYILVLILSVCFILVYNGGIILTVLLFILENRRRDWNMTAQEIIEYIGRWSYLSKSFERDHVFELSSQALQYACRDGRLKIAGRRPGDAQLTRLGRKERRSLIFRVEGHKVGGVLRAPTSLAIYNRDNPNDRYDSVFADRAEVEAIWPRGRS
jgi:hypothetical protein